MLALANAIEKRLAGVYNSTADRSSKVTAPEEGQVAYLKDTNTWTYYNGSAWVGLFPTVPTFTVSSTAPAGGTNGDVWLQV
jgi:hypothetical protein